jgi:hypothetical protein
MFCPDIESPLGCRVATTLQGKLFTRNYFADRISDAKELVADGTPDDAHIGTAVHVVLRKIAPWSTYHRLISKYTGDTPR